MNNDVFYLFILFTISVVFLRLSLVEMMVMENVFDLNKMRDFLILFSESEALVKRFNVTTNSLSEPGYSP